MVRWLYLLLPLLAAGSTSTSTSTRDVSLRQYSETGRVLQIDYAANAVASCLPVVAFTSALTPEDHEVCSVVLRLRHTSSLLVVPVRAFDRVDNLLMCAVGYPPDCRNAIRQVNGIVQQHKLTYGEQPTADYVSRELSRWACRGLFRESRDDPMTRPLAAAVLVCPLRSDGAKGDMLHMVSNSGVVAHRQYFLQGRLSASTMTTFTALLETHPPLGLAHTIERIVEQLLLSEEGSVVDAALVRHSTGEVVEHIGMASAVQARELFTQLHAPR